RARRVARDGCTAERRSPGPHPPRPRPAQACGSRSCKPRPGVDGPEPRRRRAHYAALPAPVGLPARALVRAGVRRLGGSPEVTREHQEYGPRPTSIESTTQRPKTLQIAAIICISRGVGYSAPLPPAEPDTQMHLQAPEQPKARIVVIDDDAVFIDLMRDLLANGEGYEVVTTAQWLNSFEFIKEVAPDLVILDLMLGRDQTGLTVLELLREDPSTAGIPVILCSAAEPALRKCSPATGN